ncbi:MAG: hypothetical protein HPY62_01935 [Bacteroidales bacterium]|nr:hypothetical protein [Bacteroidales bacterium]
MRNIVDSMMNRTLYTVMLMSVISFQGLIAQDLIIKKSGEEIKAKVLEIGIEGVTYKRYDNQSGPSYVVPKADISVIRYENGTEDVFGTVNSETANNAVQEQPVTVQKADIPEAKFKPFFSMGFNILMHNGIYGGTVPARPDGGSFYPSGGDPYTGLGFGVNMGFRISEFLGLYFDINRYDSKTPVAYAGGYATSDWVFEMNDYNTRLIGPFSENANYLISTTGMRLGVRLYAPLKKKQIQPWYGIYYGYYNVTLGVYSEDKKSTYGNTNEDVTGLTYLNVGVDFWDKSRSFGGTLFAEFGSPVVRNYKIEDCLHTGWVFQDYGEGTHLFGYNRIGLSLNFVSSRKK